MSETATPFTAPGGTTQALLDALRARLAACLADMHLPTDVEGEAPRAPEIIDGFLPPKRGKVKGRERGEFPFVIVPCDVPATCLSSRAFSLRRNWPRRS